MTSGIHIKTLSVLTVSANCQKEAVCDDALGQPLGSRLSDSADGSHQAAALVRAEGRLISNCTQGFPLREAGSSPLLEEAPLK